MVPSVPSSSRLQSITPLTVNTLNPGFYYSQLRRDLRGSFIHVTNFIMEICLARTSEQGSRQLVYAAIGERDSEDHMTEASQLRSIVQQYLV
ncbi:hypothetical protein JVT61DRAFT_14725 [Boletus reticuloceps]|uniref:Uncharacterized protein n=1 Tax=Boletus reticuloceps TaxID=495285 RepID=A0A8I2YRF8_9AGAM|nr:hypothetical protein JVT61DRAFT_14725 [Boletus reticuloceps]